MEYPHTPLYWIQLLYLVVVIVNFYTKDHISNLARRKLTNRTGVYILRLRGKTCLDPAETAVLETVVKNCDEELAVLIKWDISSSVPGQVFCRRQYANLRLGRLTWEFILLTQCLLFNLKKSKILKVISLLNKYNKSVEIC